MLRLRIKYHFRWEFHTEKSRIVLNNNGAIITMFFYWYSYMNMNTGLLLRPTRSWSTHQLNSTYTVASLGLIYISSMIVTKYKHENNSKITFVNLWLVFEDAIESKEKISLIPASWYEFITFCWALPCSVYTEYRISRYYIGYIV